MHLSSEQAPADRDFELTWTPAPGHTVQAAAFAERAGPDIYALIMLNPPNQADETSQPREVTFIIDTSGSMGGPSIQQACAALQKAHVIPSMPSCPAGRCAGWSPRISRRNSTVSHPS